MTRPSWLVLLAAATSLVRAQTIVVGGQTAVADEKNVAPAAEEVSVDAGEDLLVSETVQLTEAVLANLTSLELSNISLFAFAEDETLDKRTPSSLFKCKTFPGDVLYPGSLVWKIFDLLTGGALIKTVPIGAVCYEGEHYDAAACEELLASWSTSPAHIVDPTSVMSPLFYGATCQPQNAATGGKCELGGLPPYSVNVTNVAQIQLAVNFARNLNLRLVVHNTGHDFLGKSTGAGALSIWTRHLKEIKLIEDYKSHCYEGPAMRLGAGVEVRELYEAADAAGYTAVGGECRTVGVTGGYIGGGGHSPLSTIAGLGSDQVLSVDIVTPDGRFITADEEQNSDLFWAVRGGGAATWGVVTSMTVKVHPKMPFSGMSWSIITPAMNMTEDTFWAVIESYWRRFPEFSAQKSYGYSVLFPIGPGLYLWNMEPWIVPGMHLDEFKEMVAPLLEDWAALGVDVQPTFFEYDNFYETWQNEFPSENVGTAEVRTGSRLIPAANWEDPALLNETIATLRELAQEGSALIHYNINAAAPRGTAASAANPAWRDALMFVIIGSGWAPDAPAEEVERVNVRITRDWMERLRQITPGGGGYGNEGDVMEPNFGQAFFGENYHRLYELKKKIDPWGVFYAPTAVGSEDWYITGQEEWLTLQTGRLCRK
ncbi:hypothetical protein F5X68DRAFT_244846 [Plectosphaerella plurivora]|uniref:FAD-binding PCMH-type domain-containing protein n=1 Tax=Plectosphaerella plurivora TaxID=936078 RepID=A0A9P8V765_9PEZI|nr:hypothetical protein F5X68DRAFT_244846 [Plectosphaerella plurivora]